MESLERSDGQPPKHREIRYTVTETPLPDSFGWENTSRSNDSFRLVLIDLSFSCAFDQCEHQPPRNMANYRPPEALLGLPATHKADIISSGLLL